MLLNILKYGNPILKSSSYTVMRTENLEKIVMDMFETLWYHKGIGLAAPQIGLQKKLFIIDDKFYPQLNLEKQIYINPSIIEMSKETELEYEACLSLPDIKVKVSRPIWIKIKYVNYNFIEIEETLESWQCKAFLHEYDHLNGTLITDKCSSMQKQLITNKLKKIKTLENQGYYEKMNIKDRYMYEMSRSNDINYVKEMSDPNNLIIESTEEEFNKNGF